MQLDIHEGSMERPVVFRINDNGTGPELLQQVFLERGWVEYDEEIHNPNEWHLWWRTSRFRTGEYSSLLPWQHINHFPSCTLITKKDALCRNLRKMKIVHGLHVYNFSPNAFNLPNDYTKFVSEYAASRQQAKKEGTPATWICKPAESSRGRGIFIFNELSELQYDCNAVVQHYIANPLLIGGYKFDIRVYVAVPSFHPLEIYIHEEGLVRFSTEKYDLECLTNVFAHLTNTSINKFSPGYSADKEEVGHGCKWTITQLRRYFLQNNIDDTRIWQQVTNIIVLTVLMQAPTAPQMSNCFELYGFDVLIDNSLKAWLLEVNFSPALSSDCHADILAKKSMLHDLMSLVRVSAPEQDQSTYNHTGRHVPSKDPDTARTVASTASRISHTSGKSFHRGSNNGLNSLSPNGNPPDSHRSRNTRRSSGSDAQDRSTKMSLSCHAINDKYSRSSKKHADDEDKLLTKTEKRNVPHSVTDRPNSGDVSQMKSDSLLYLNGNSKDKSPTKQSSDLLFDSHRKNVNTNAFFCENVNGIRLDVNESNCNTNKTNSSPVRDNEVFEKAPRNGVSPVDYDQQGGAADTTNKNSLHPGYVPLLNGHDDIEEEGDICGEDGHKYEIKIVKGNMKGQGLKHVVSPIPPISNRKEKQNKVTSLAISRRLEKKSNAAVESPRRNGMTQQRQLQQQQYQRPRTHSYPSASIHPDSGYTNHHNSIPRNFSRLETSRFPLPLHHAHYNNPSPGKNGTAPLSRIPQRQVGRLFLVFPFNEATQKLSSGNLDPKLVIKEILRQDAKNRKAGGHNTPNGSQGGIIWSSIKNS